MVTGGAPRRYAEAIFELAREANTFDTWQADLNTIAQFASDPGAEAFFQSPKNTGAQKRQLAETYLRDRVQPVALNLARVLVERDRLPLIGRVAEVFAAMVRAHRGIAVAEVTTAIPLDAAGAEDVRQRLGLLVGKQIELEQHVDPAIIGGIVARVDDFLIDGSVRGQLSRLRARLVEG